MTSTISTKPLLVIVPAFNEQESISQVVSDIRAEQLDVLVVDDGSSDEMPFEQKQPAHRY